jgi:hypothetical protein
MTTGVQNLRGRIRSREVDVAEVYFEGRLRVAVVICPFCKRKHEHSVPVDTLATARLERAPKCDARNGVYTLRMPADST